MAAAAMCLAIVGAEARAGGSHVTWAVRDGAAPPLSVRTCRFQHTLSLFTAVSSPRARGPRLCL